MPQQAPLYIVASPRPRVGKTLIARLLTEFFRSNGRALVGYDLDPREPTFAGYFPDLVATMNIADTPGQMALFDRLLAGVPRTTVIDLGYGLFEQFFDVMTEIAFVQDARLRCDRADHAVLTDRSPGTVRAYADVRRRLETTAFVPVHDESVSVMYEKADFPPSLRRIRRHPHPAPLRDRARRRQPPSFSFGAYMTERPGGPTEIHSWIGTIFTEFRELELRLLMGKLGESLGGGFAARLSSVLRPAR